MLDNRTQGDRTEKIEPYYGASSSPRSSHNYVMERLHSLERENEHFRDELLHVRQLMSNNSHHRDDERVSSCILLLRLPPYHH